MIMHSKFDLCRYVAACPLLEVPNSASTIV
ncbi:hypothetical protein L195_g029835 [Trifolium pratense]|uniref:Uncharacterized protein n=1 Tax=Trifolium pratense TaxID=57577 RepID=A0A2K3L5W0_TRIPR|nr:hypothetical protein L195_g029835 [Trifolium pratense]